MNTAVAEDYLTMLNANLLWTISDFKNYSCTMEITSPPFVIESDYQYKMRLFLYPETDTHTTDSALEVEVTCVTEPLFATEFTFSIINIRGEKCYTKSLTSETKVEFINSIHNYLNIESVKDESSGLLVQNKLRILCEMKTLYTDIHLNTVPKYEVSNTLETFFENEKFSDITIIDEIGNRIPAHRILLSATSPVFAAMFEHNMRENSEKTVTISNIDSKCLKEMLRYMYTGRVDKLEEFASDLLVASNQYGLDNLKRTCEITLLNQLSVESAIATLVVADKHNAIELKEKVIEFITEHAKDVINTSAYKGLESSDLVKEVLCAIVLKKK